MRQFDSDDPSNIMLSPMTRRIRRHGLLSACALAVLMSLTGAPGPARAESTRRWEQTRYSDFRKGTARKISIRSDGKLMLAPRLSELSEPPASYLWSIAVDSRGNVFAGGGPGAAVYRIGADGRKSTFFEQEGLEVHALAIDGDDNVYAATSPDPKIYKIDPSGRYEVFFDPPSTYVWDMAFDSSGNLYVATGDKGEIYRVSPGGEGRVVFDTGETHVRALAIDPQGRLIAGTDPSGLIFRIDAAADAEPAGTGAVGFVLFQSKKKEITALALASDGSIYAAGVGDRVTRPAAARVTVTRTSPASPARADSGDARRDPSPRTRPRALAPAVSPSALLSRVVGGSEVYRIAPDGETRAVWRSATEIVYSLAVDRQGRLLLGTGDDGRLVRLESDDLYSLLLTAPSEQITALESGRDGRMFLATSNIGKIYELSPELETEGEFESDVFDAKTFSDWGRLNWQGAAPEGSKIAISTRSGNLNRASRNWSPWAEPGASAAGRRAGAPPARFLQWRAVLSGGEAGAPELDSVTLHYFPRNRAPVMRTVETTRPNHRFPAQSRSAKPAVLVLPAMGGAPAVPGSPRGAGSSGKASQTMTPAAGYRGARWRAEDQNQDKLSFKIEIRGEGEKHWKLLEEDVSSSHLDWDTTSFADGLYRVRVTASDRPSNPASEAKSDAKISEPFTIDNSAPVIADLSAQPGGGALQVRFTVADATSVIDRAEYSLDGGDWELLLPVSRLFDSKDLAFDFLTSSTESGEHTVAVRVHDRFENLVTSKVVVR